MDSTVRQTWTSRGSDCPTRALLFRAGVRHAVLDCLEEHTFLALLHPYSIDQTSYAVVMPSTMSPISTRTRKYASSFSEIVISVSCTKYLRSGECKRAR